MTITYEMFRDTGRFIPSDVYLKENPTARLHDDCTEVIIYTNDFIIQALKSNEFYIKVGRREIKHTPLDVVESALWYLRVEKVINKSK
jgi:hypothetical protein